MEIEFSKKFTKQFSKQPVKIKQVFYKRLEIFEQDEHDAILRNHALKGKYQNYRSIDITGDVRALYVKRGETIVIFGFIGSHSQLYR
ncbi:MAG: type II toxin-antitoxin system mRNA interferase toxin, RelE/StbE family [Patescibacteria group bacterium]